MNDSDNLKRVYVFVTTALGKDKSCGTYFHKQLEHENYTKSKNKNNVLVDNCIWSIPDSQQNIICKNWNIKKNCSELPTILPMDELSKKLICVIYIIGKILSEYPQKELKILFDLKLIIQDSEIDIGPGIEDEANYSEENINKILLAYYSTFTNQESKEVLIDSSISKSIVDAICDEYMNDRIPSESISIYYDETLEFFGIEDTRKNSCHKDEIKEDITSIKLTIENLIKKKEPKINTKIYFFLHGSTWGHDYRNDCFISGYNSTIKAFHHSYDFIETKFLNKEMDIEDFKNYVSVQENMGNSFEKVEREENLTTEDIHTFKNIIGILAVRNNWSIQKKEEISCFLDKLTNVSQLNANDISYLLTIRRELRRSYGY